MKKTIPPKWYFFLTFILATTFPFSALAITAPKEIAGIVLGSRVDSYPDIIDSNFMKEVVVTDWHGFRKGNVSYGVCRYKGEILKIDMKYEDKSKSFYKQLLQKFQEQFGQADSWKGDSFGVVHIWKWQFIDDEQNRVSLSLQYNAKDPDHTIGNIMKLSYPDKIKEERLCFVRMCEQNKQQTDEKYREELKKTDWSYLIPR